MHGKVVADRQYGVIERVKALQKLHIAVKRGVAGKVQFGAVKIYNKAAGMAACYTAAVEGWRNAYMAKIKFVGAAKVHAAAYFGGGNYRGIAGFGNFKSAADMVKMCMGN